MILEMRNISKDYAGNRVLKGVNLAVEEGEIHSLVGENGAGKSTLMNVLFGMPVIRNTGGFTGEILFDGRNVDISSPKEAMKLGIGMVHQEFVLLPGFSVLENVKLNREKTKPNFLSRVFGKKMETLNYPEMRRDVRTALDSLEVSIDEMMPVRGLPVGYMQFVEIARELDKSKIRLLVLDEPTAVLTESEADTLLGAMRHLRENGISILFISHRLTEVVAVSDHVTIVRDGELVGRLSGGEADVEWLAELMVGRKISDSVRQRSVPAPETDSAILSVRNLRVRMPGEEVRDVSLEVRRGEILGIGGLAGQGKVGIANGIMGLYPAEGDVTKDGFVMSLNNPREAMNAKMALVSEDRRGVGLLLDQSIELNIAIRAMQTQGKFLKRIAGMSRIDAAAMRAHAARMMRDLDIRAGGEDQHTRRLSGGNQQKVCIAAALTLSPDLLFVSEPTRGIDIGAKKIVLDLLCDLNRTHGVTIVITSSELAELRAICDRIAVIYEGRLAGIVPWDASNRELGLLMAGAAKDGRVSERGAA